MNYPNICVEGNNQKSPWVEPGNPRIRSRNCNHTAKTLILTWYKYVNINSLIKVRYQEIVSKITEIWSSN
jgi:hypothetical protein